MNSKDISFLKLTVYGLVQGVGFRPYTVCLCEELGIIGFVRNTGGSVEIVAGGKRENLEELIRRLNALGTEENSLPGSLVTSVSRKDITGEEFEQLSRGRNGFYIEKSDNKGRLSIVPADIGICENCSDELTNKKNRRFGHPFISCVSCGPRFSIMRSLPYDRENTSMSVFPLCTVCSEEYEKSPFRTYAQTVSCNECGPFLKAYVKRDGNLICAAAGSEALRLTVAYIRKGGICAVKNVGGYHFAFDAANDGAALRLRKTKLRENKPFAVMFSDLDTVRKYCFLSDVEKKLLCSDARPIVLLKNKPDSSETDRLSTLVCKNSIRTGAMLPCDGIQILLSKEFPALVMTSANMNSEPIVRADDRAFGFLSDDAVDIVLSNDREVVHSLDDSILQVVKLCDKDLIQFIRRARGFVPKSIETGRYFDKDIFAAGGDLKAVFGFGTGSSVILSGHYGDIENAEAYELREADRTDFETLFGLKTGNTVCDLHPGYLSGREAEKNGHEPYRLQHHYSHIMSVAAEHKLKKKLLGLALDGTGYGTDGKVWGSELLLCDPDDPGNFERVGHFEEILMAGGESAVKNADITATCYIFEGIRRGCLKENENPYEGNSKLQVIEKALENGINTYGSTSAGRLFDAISAVLDICHENSYEGECPVLLQQEAEVFFERSDEMTEKSLPRLDPGIKREGKAYVFETVKLLCDCLRLKNRGYSKGALALSFHKAVCEGLIEQFTAVRNDTGINTAALSGGVFVNSLMMRLLYDGLKGKGFDVFVNEKVPPTDGGLALGQIYGAPCR